MRTVNAIVPYFGANRLNAERVGKLLAGCHHVAIPFLGSGAEIKYITARSIVANDLHKHVINLFRVARDPVARALAYRELRRAPYHPEILREAQAWCQAHRPQWQVKEGDIEAAYQYFITQWMGRSGNAGTDKEFTGKLAIRWNANGGGSNVRYRSAVRAFLYWGKLAERCEFDSCDASEFIDKVNDAEKCGLYVDAPWPDAGEPYVHKFDEAKQRRLAARLLEFQHTRIVVRFGDHPLIRHLYPEAHWRWEFVEGRTQGNNAIQEVLLVRNEAPASKTEEPTLFDGD